MARALMSDQPRPGFADGPYNARSAGTIVLCAVATLVVAWVAPLWQIRSLGGSRRKPLRIMAGISSPGIAPRFAQTRVSIRLDTRLLRALAVATGLSWSILFVALGLGYDLQLFGDGSIFSYSVAVEDGWLFHWHNISVRLFVHLFSHVPAETYVRFTGDARGGILLYGFLFFGAQLLGLALTLAVDRSQGRIIFSYACFSTACLCPLVFGAPTEMWMAHALFWPTLAACHYARGPLAGPTVFALLLALVLTHEGALIFALVILASLLLRGPRDAAFITAVRAFILALTMWVAVRLAFPPDDYFASVLPAAALNFIDVSSLAVTPILLLAGALAGYFIAFLVLRRIAPAWAHAYAGSIVVAILAVYWLASDGSVIGEDKYYLRTALLIFTPAFGAMAAAYALEAEHRLKLPVPFLPRLLSALDGEVAVRAAAGAIVMVSLVHAIETAKFVVEWRHYQAAVRTLAIGSASDPQLGDPRFVSSDRIPVRLRTVQWSSTTHFLAVLVAPAFAPARLVVDPDASYFWLSCKTAAANCNARRAIPVASRELVRVHACLHR